MIALHEPSLTEHESHLVQTCLASGWIAGGTFIHEFEQAVAAYTGAKYAVATSSGSAALHVAMLAAGIGPGDRVLVTDLTFMAPVNAIIHCGATPVLVDVDAHGWQMDLGLLENWLEKERRQGALRSVTAIVAVHVLGAMGDMARLKAIAANYDLILIEDAAEALGTCWEGKHAGTWGAVGCLSFNGNKIVSTGGGGMVLTDNEHLAQRVRHLINQAKTTADGYIHDLPGYNYRLPNINAAIGVAQMARLPAMLAQKACIAEWYRAAFRQIEDQIMDISIPPEVRWNHWLLTKLMPRPAEILTCLKQHQITARMLWPPASSQVYCADFEYITADRQAFRIYSQSLSLPSSVSLTQKQVEHIVTIIATFLSH